MVYRGTTKGWHLPWGESVNINRCCVNSHCGLLAPFLKVNACLALKIGHGHFPNLIVNKSEPSPLQSTVAVNRQPVKVGDMVQSWGRPCGNFYGQSTAGAVLRIYHFGVVNSLIRPGRSGDRLPGGRFSASRETVHVFHPHSVQWVSCLFLEGKAAGAWPWAPTVI